MPSRPCVHSKRTHTHPPPGSPWAKQQHSNNGPRKALFRTVNPSVPALLGCTTSFSPPSAFFFLYTSTGMWSTQSVCMCVCVCVCVWYKVLEGISRDDRVSLSSFDKHSYILRNSLTRCRGRRPSCLFPVKLLIWKQPQCLRWCLESGVGGWRWGGVAGKRKTDTRDAFVKDFKSDLFLTLTFPKRIKHVCGILIGQDFLHYPRIWKPLNTDDLLQQYDIFFFSVLKRKTKHKCRCFTPYKP